MPTILTHALIPLAAGVALGRKRLPPRLVGAGMLAAMLRQRLGADPALGGSVLITALTDSGGFFIFLGLATLFLL